MKYDGKKADEYKKFRGEYVKNRSFDDFLNSAKEFINLNQNDEMGDRVDESEEMDFSDPIF